MLSISARTTETNPNLIQRIMEKASGMVEKGVVAGFPRGKLNTPHYESNGKGKQGPSIVDVAIANNYGIGVPRRDFMTPSAKRWNKFFKESLAKVQKELLANKINPNKFLKAMGQKGADIISQEIISLSTPPNSPATIAKKKSSNPLVDTGDMARSTTWQIRENKNK